MSKYLELPFIDIDTELVKWENDQQKDHMYCALILSQLQHLYKYRDALMIDTEDDYMMLTTDRILESLRYCLGNRKLTKALQTLEDDGLIERPNKRNGAQTIKLNQEKIDELIGSYRSDSKRKFFIVYYVCLGYEQAKHAGSRVSYLLSAFMQMAQSGSFPSNMSDNYLNVMMGGVFTRSQLTNMMKILHTDKLLMLDSRTVKIGESFCSRRHVFLRGDVITELITKYYRDDIETTEMQSIDLNSAIPSRAIKKTDEKKVGKSFDGVKSETPDDDDMDAIRARWAELAAQGKRVEY